MTPAVVHRYAFPVREAIEALLGSAAGDAEAWQIRVDGDQVVVDVVRPARVRFAQSDFDHCDSTIANETSVVVTDSASTPQIVPSEAEPSPRAATVVTEKPKGGALARQAGILCTTGSFRVWADVRDEAAARDFILRICGISSRVDLDYDNTAAEIFKTKIVREYDFWMSAP